MTHSYAKDKIKQVKEVDDDSKIQHFNENDEVQCPLCKQLHNNHTAHKCSTSWRCCSICGLDLDKKQKEVMMPNGHSYVSMRKKKNFRVINTIICWNCAFNIHKMFKKQLEERNDID